MRVLLVVPPFGGLDRPSLGLHLLQAAARDAGHEVNLLYANMLFARSLGEFAYLNITEWPTLDLLGERVMGLRFGSQITAEMLHAFNQHAASEGARRGYTFDPISVSSIETSTAVWLESLDNHTALQTDYHVVGLCSTFEQTNGLRLLAQHLRQRFPDSVLIAGGANCEADMAQAISDYVPDLDYVFSGESEHTFVDFLNNSASYTAGRIIHSFPNKKLDALPAVDFAEFFDQLDTFLPNSITRRSGSLQLPYESSRGCWWGQKHHCTFCGLNGSGMGFREKSAEKVLSELQTLSRRHSVNRVCMTDNIMPFSYFETLVPLLAREEPRLQIFYEQKANISLQRAVDLYSAGITRIQPGIEALNDNLLRLMKKGTTARQNIALLRYARVLNIDLAWNLLTGFPGEEEWFYEETLDWIPKMHHLQPPTGVCRMSIDRFNPYFERPDDYGIKNVRPHPSYESAFPDCRNLQDLAYHFECDSSAIPFQTSAPLQALKIGVDTWRSQWRASASDGAQAVLAKPGLEVVALTEHQYILIDTRALPDQPVIQELSTEQAQTVLTWSSQRSELVDWAQGLGYVIGGRGTPGFIPLACSDVRTLEFFERRKRAIEPPIVAKAPTEPPNITAH